MTMEEAQKKAARAFLPITDNCLVAFAMSSLLIYNSLLHNRPDWDGKPKVQKKWDAQKSTFLPLHRNLKCKTHLVRGVDSFGTAAAA